MKFEKFKKIFLTYGICEVEFSFTDCDKSKIRIENYNHKNNKRLILVDSKKIYFLHCVDVFNASLIDGLTLECLWDRLQIDIIDGMDKVDYEEWYSTVDFFDLEYFHQHQIDKNITNEELIERICKDEYEGNLLLLAGTSELNELDTNDFKIIIDVPKINRYYIVQSIQGVVYIDILISFIQELRRLVKKDKNYKVGRLITFYKDKNAKYKSIKYRELLKYEKSLNSAFWGGLFLIIEILSIQFLLLSIVLVKDYPLMLVVAILWLILSWVIIFKFGKEKSKKELVFREKYFPNINQNEILKCEMNNIILEKYETKFESLLSKIINDVPKIKITGPFLEDNTIDLQLEKNQKALYFNFETKFLFVFDENDDTFYFKYEKYSYEELENELVKFVINHFN